jgi:uncharacterized protein
MLELNAAAPDRSTGAVMSAPVELPIFTFVLVKLASRCNINCTYCYWFRDPEVYNKPPVLTLEAEDAFCARLEQHIREFGLARFQLVFHGGEPLLFPKYRFIDLQKKLREIEFRTGCRIERGVTTNAILVDEEWANLFRTNDVQVTVSLDGPPEINDKYRVDFKGRGTIAATLRGIDCLRAAGIDPGLISVCNPSTDPERVLAYVVEELEIKQFDILPPDATHSDHPPPIADYFIKLFDVWFDRYAERGVRISTLDAMIRGLTGHLSVSDTIGLGPIDTVTLMTDGPGCAEDCGPGLNRIEFECPHKHAPRYSERAGLAGGASRQYEFGRGMPSVRIPGFLRGRPSRAALVARAPIRQSQRLLRELETNPRAHLAAHCSDAGARTRRIQTIGAKADSVGIDRPQRSPTPWSGPRRESMPGKLNSA